MSLPNDRGRSFDPLSEDDAIAIMEGREPAEDHPDLNQDALLIAQGLLSERERGGVMPFVAPFAARQPWMKMAAAMVLGVLVSTLVTVDIDVNGGSGIASSSVVYLETYRGADSAELPVVRIGTDDPWLTLVAYPDHTNAQQLRISVERAVGETTSDDAWTQVLGTNTGTGNKDAVAVSVPAELLTPGTYRLLIEADSGSVINLGFRIEN
jgi:hypothetical protein